jgi:hypothetical protein
MLLSDNYLCTFILKKRPFKTSLHYFLLKTTGIHYISVVDPHSFRFGSGSSILGISDPNPDPGFSWPNIVKNLQLEKIKFLIKNRIYLSLVPYSIKDVQAVRRSLQVQAVRRSLQVQSSTPSLKREHPALKNVIFLLFCGSFLTACIRIRIQPTNMNANLCGSGSTTLLGYRTVPMLRYITGQSKGQSLKY